MQQKQMDIVYNIIKLGQPIRTEQIKIVGMYNGVSCADRYIRWLVEQGKVRGIKLPGDKTKTWIVTCKPTQLTLGGI